MDNASRTQQLNSALNAATGVLHIGAHLGQEAQKYAELGKSVCWIEAQPDIHEGLRTKLEKYPDQQSLCALVGTRNGEMARLNISNNARGVSSSMYEFGSFGSGSDSLWPDLGLEMVSSYSLPTIRLNTLLEANNVDPAAHNHWVVDVQGAELPVLRGAGPVLASCKSMFVEVSTVEVYKDATTWDRLQSWLGRQGFQPAWQPKGGHDDVLFIQQ